jgi:copper chaperone CopZ
VKKYIILLSIVSFVFAGEKTTKIKVKGMACQYSCPTQVKSALNDVKGIKMCNVNYETSTATVTYNEDEIQEKDIAKILNDKTDFEISVDNPSKEEPSGFKKFFSKFFKS